MALIYNMRAMAQSDNSYIFWTDTEPDLDGTNAPETIVAGTATILSVNGSAGSGGLASPHDTAYSPVGLWNFGGDLTDSSGNGLDLSIATGSTAYFEILPGLPAVTLNNISIGRNAYDASLNIMTAFTIEFIAYVSNDSTTDIRTLVNFVGNAGVETEADNFIYGIRLTSADVLENTIEYSTGSNGFRTTTISRATHLVKPTHVAVTQTADGKTNKFYINGVLMETVTDDANQAATGGTNARLGIGGSYSLPTGGNRQFAKNSAIASVKIVASELTADEIKAEYNRTIGPVYGLI